MNSNPSTPPPPEHTSPHKDRSTSGSEVKQGKVVFYGTQRLTIPESPISDFTFDHDTNSTNNDKKTDSIIPNPNSNVNPKLIPNGSDSDLITPKNILDNVTQDKMENVTQEILSNPEHTTFSMIHTKFNTNLMNVCVTTSYIFVLVHIDVIIQLYNKYTK